MTVWRLCGRLPSWSHVPQGKQPLGFGQRLSTVPTHVRDDHYHFVHLLSRQQRPECATMSRLTAALPARRGSFGSPWTLGWIKGGWPGGIGRGLTQAGFQVPDTFPLGEDQRLGRSRGRGPNL